MRTALYEADHAGALDKWCGVKAWSVRIAKTRGHKRAVVAVARKFAVIMHRMWMDDNEFRFSANEEPQDALKKCADDAGDRVPSTVR